MARTESQLYISAFLKWSTGPSSNVPVYYVVSRTPAERGDVALAYSVKLPQLKCQAVFE
jgi:hypothetical protein